MLFKNVNCTFWGYFILTLAYDELEGDNKGSGEYFRIMSTYLHVDAYTYIYKRV